MSSLLELQRRFAHVLIDEAEVADAGLAIYRRAVFTNWRNALGATFGVVRAQTGAPFFDAAVDAFARAHPSTGGDLNVYGDAFASFLAHYPHAQALPYLPDVARLEWALDEAQRADDDAGSPEALLSALAAVAPDAVASLRFRLEHSCRLLRSPYPILRIWQVHQPTHDGPQDVAFDGPDDLLLVQRESGRVAVERLAAGEYAWVAALASGASFASALDAALACDATFDLAGVLRRRVVQRTLAALA